MILFYKSPIPIKKNPKCEAPDTAKTSPPPPLAPIMASLSAPTFDPFRF